MNILQGFREPDNQNQTTDRPDWSQSDIEDQAAFRAIIEARKTFLGVIEISTAGLNRAYPYDALEMISAGIISVLEDSGIPTDDKDIAEFIDEAIEEEAEQDAEAA
jgi:hypothetical protein